MRIPTGILCKPQVSITSPSAASISLFPIGFASLHMPDLSHLPHHHTHFIHISSLQFLSVSLAPTAHIALSLSLPHHSVSLEKTFPVSHPLPVTTIPSLVSSEPVFLDVPRVKCISFAFSSFVCVCMNLKMHVQVHAFFGVFEMHYWIFSWLSRKLFCYMMIQFSPSPFQSDHIVQSRHKKCFEGNKRSSN